MNKIYIWYFVYEIIYTLLWLSFIAFLVYHFDNPNYLWLLLVMIFGGMYIKDKKKECEDGETN